MANKPLQTVATCAHSQQRMATKKGICGPSGEYIYIYIYIYIYVFIYTPTHVYIYIYIYYRWPFCENPAYPDPVWKPVTMIACPSSYYV